MAAAEKKALSLSLQRTMQALKERASKNLTFVTTFDCNKNDPLRLETLRQTLEEMRMSFFDAEGKIYGLIKDDEVASIRLFGEEFYDLLSEISYQISKKLKPLVQSPVKPSLDPNVVPKSCPDTKIKLPDITLPRFSGHYEEWLYFRGQFNHLIRRNESLNDQQRLHYLRSCLSGEAASIETPEESFSSLWKALESRYENRRWLVDRHLAEIFQIKPIQGESSSALRDLINVVQKNLRALSSLNLNIDPLSEAMVVNIVASRLDKQTHKDFESNAVGTDLIKWSEMVEFLQNRCRILENIEVDHKFSARNPVKSAGIKQPAKVFVSSSRPEEAKKKFSCFHCSGTHYINECRNFLAKSPAQRFQRVKELRLCVNCFSNRHVVADCKSSSCKDCGQRHNTLLHFESKQVNAAIAGPKSSVTSTEDPRDGPSRVELCTVSKPSEARIPKETSRDVVPSHRESSPKKVQLMVAVDQALLHTAIVFIRGGDGELQECRAVLDSCAMSTFMTAACVRRLRLKTYPSDVSVVGFGGAGKKIVEAVVAEVSSKSSFYQSSAEFLVTPSITTKLPLRRFDIDKWDIPEWLNLADPFFNQPAKIDILFGIIDWDKMMLSKSYKIADELPSFRQTVFGWVAGGAVIQKPNYPILHTLSVTNEQLDEQISQFWHLESYGHERHWSVEEQAAEDHFVSTHTRDETGRYVVALPFKDPEVTLGDSKHMARRRFGQLEARLVKDQQLYADYRQFMQEYIDLGHMKRIGTFDPEDTQSTPCYFMPHHAVLRPESSTTKLRVVFDASAKTSNGLSLNNQLMVGPTLQPRIIDTLLAFRTFKIAVTCDVSKMFRQIMVRKEDCPFQQILWRPSIEEEIGVYQLTTVTYGTACAPFLATRTLMQICDDEAEGYPLAAHFGKKSVYVDDALFGAETVEEARQMRDEFIGLFARAGFELHKWCSNHEQVLAGLPEDKLEKKVLFSEEGRTKTLGLTWQPSEDIFSFEILSIAFSEGVPTKRKVLSDISKLFDPLGFAGPVVMTGKIIMQELWRTERKWDDTLDPELLQLWNEFRRQLQELRAIKIDRCVLPLLETVAVELVGFCDASQKGFGACLYIRSRNSQGHISVKLLCAKSHVAPLKANRSTIPRLELCGALLLAQLVEEVKRSLPITVHQVRLWSDSTIALNWINTCPSKLDVFVSNRVAKIQKATNPKDWSHVGTHQNPADLISRGIMPSELEAADQWWQGPTFLQNSEETWPSGVQRIVEEALPELITTVAIPVAVERFNLFENCSKFPTMVRAIARIKRMFQNHQRKPEDRRHGELSPEEIRYAKLTIVRLAQKEAFPEVFAQLNTQVTIKNHSLIPLSPFVDDHGVLRVGGRLSKSSCSYDTKHQMILPPGHPLTAAIIRHVHKSNMHAGTQLTLAAVRREFWIVKGRSTVKKAIRDCTICFKNNPKPVRQYMGDLPMCRLDGQYPFYRTGIDLCGPVYIKQRNKRSTVEHKSWITLFICLATKAIHLDLVSELSTGAFMQAFDRFVSRRGTPLTVWTDNGTNFVGTKNQLEEWKDFIECADNQDSIQRAHGNDIEWRFNPPDAPHFGGIWEANIRQAKSLLVKHTAGAALTFEEMSTVLARIEAILNSRPITPLSDDPEDFEPLTPGHFLVFRPLNAVARPEVDNNKALNSKSRFEHITQIVQHFWNRWHLEYLSSLQERYKWHKKVVVKVGQLVLVKMDNMPVQRWLLGRIVETFPGTDGVTRVVNVRTQNGIIRRPVSKLCFLPVDTTRSIERHTFQRGEDDQNN